MTCNKTVDVNRVWIPGKGSQNMNGPSVSADELKISLANLDAPLIAIGQTKSGIVVLNPVLIAVKKR